MKAINIRVIPVASYVIHVWSFTEKQLDELLVNKMIKQEMRDAKLHGLQTSNEKLYLSREHGGRGVKSAEDVCEDIKIWVAGDIAYQNSECMQPAWAKETEKEGHSLSKDAAYTLAVSVVNAVLDDNGAHFNGLRMIGGWKKI